MLPFLKKKEEGAMSELVPEFGTMDAIAQDMMEAFDKKDVKLLKAALEALKDSLEEADASQDKQLLTNEA